MLVAKQLTGPAETESPVVDMTSCNDLLTIKLIWTNNSTNKLLPACRIYEV